MAVAALAAAAGSSLATVGASLGAAAIQSATAKSTNQTNLEFQKSLIDRGEKSFTDKGLPSFLYWGGQSATTPNSLIHLGGQNFYEQSGVNSNLPYFTGAPYSQWNHVGTSKIQQQRPSPGSSQISSGMPIRTGRTTTSISSTREGTQSDPGRISFTVGSNTFSGQTDKKGLGAGRYSAVPPPTLSYNSVGVQVSPYMKSSYAQATTGSRDAFAQTGGRFTNNKGIMTQNLYTRDVGTMNTPNSYVNPSRSVFR